MPRLCSPWRDSGRVTLSCVAGDGGAPRVRRLVALVDREADRVLAILQAFGRVFFNLFPGFPFLVTSLGFGLLLPVAM